MGSTMGSFIIFNMNTLPPMDMKPGEEVETVILFQEEICAMKSDYANLQKQISKWKCENYELKQQVNCMEKYSHLATSKN